MAVRSRSIARASAPALVALAAIVAHAGFDGVCRDACGSLPFDNRSLDTVLRAARRRRAAIQRDDAISSELTHRLAPQGVSPTHERLGATLLTKGLPAL
jgi:hypothetical protein